MKFTLTCICIITATLCYFGAAIAEPPEWTFDDPAEIEGWGALNQVNLTVEDGVLKTVSLGGDPYFFPGGDWNTRDWEPFSGKDFFTIYLSVKVNKTDTWQVYYVTEEETGWAETQRQNFEVEATDDFVDLEFVMERGGWQERTVTGFRIDPGVSEGVEAEIDYISLKGAPTAVETNGKIATSWGKLKNQL
ncbi:MAG: hypothetical protein ACE5PV_03175 [Candidatus Poribacteria bacterium]